MNVGKIYIRPLHLVTYRTFNSEYYSNLRKKIIENYNYNNKKKRIFVQKEPKKIVTNYGSFQNFDKTKWSPVDIVVEMKSIDKTDVEWIDVKKIL